MLESIGSLSLLSTVGYILGFFIAIQLAATILCILFAISKGVLGELMRLILKRKHLQENLMGIALLASSLVSYYYFHHLMRGISTDISLAEALQAHPHVGWYVMIITVVFVIFIPLDTIQRIVETHKRCKQLAIWRAVRAIIGKLDGVLGLVKGPWGKRLVIGRLLIEWAGEKAVGHTVRKAIQRFLARSSVEFGARVSIIIGAIYCATGKIVLW